MDCPKVPKTEPKDDGYEVRINNYLKRVKNIEETNISKRKKVELRPANYWRAMKTLS